MDDRQTGTVKAWIDGKGMGFITPASGGEDHFCHRSMLTDGQALQIGATVTFVPNWDAEKNKPIATAVQGALAGPSPAAPAPAWGQQPPWSAPGKGAPGKGGGAYGGKGGAGTHMGTVKAWMDSRGMGFITPADGGEDLFVHRSMLVDGAVLAVGDSVTYNPGWDAQKNKGTASNVCGASASPTESSNLFVSQLPPSVTDEELYKIFGQYGTVVSTKVLPDNGSPARVALVKMSDAQQAQWLVLNVDGNIPLGLETVVGIKYANEKSGGGGAGPAPGPPKPLYVPPPMQSQQAPGGKSDNLYMCGLPLDMTNESLTAIIGQYGTVTSVKVMAANGKPDVAALVRMSSVMEAEWIVNNLNGNMPQGLENPLTIKFATDSSSKGGKGGDKGYGAAPPPPAWQAAKGASPYGGGKGCAGKAYAPAPQPYAPPAPAFAAGPRDKIEITGLPAQSTMMTVAEILGQYGTVIGVTMPPGKPVVVQMQDEAEAKWILENLNGNIPQGLDTVITVVFPGGGGAGKGGAPPGPPAAPGMVSGTVKHWVEERGMGFITNSETGVDCFVHRSNMLDGVSLVVGAAVTFQQEWDQAKGKPVAMQVTGAFGDAGYGKGGGKGKW